MMTAKLYKQFLNKQFEILQEMWKEENTFIHILSGNTQILLKIIELKLDIVDKLYRLEHER